MFWRTYFRLLSAVFVIGIGAALFGLVQLPTNSAIDLFDGALAIVALAGLFGYAWRREVLPRRFWQVFVPAYIVWEIWITFFREDPVISASEVPEALIIGLLILPLYYALVRYAYFRPFATAAATA